MQQLITKGIVIGRVDYGEADRIVTMLTPDVGKLSLMAKGVRRVKSKLAGGIELFSISEITYMPGRSGMGRLVSTRLNVHYGVITQDIDRTMLGYELIKLLHKVTEEETEREYYDLLERTLESLNDRSISSELIRVWFRAQLLALAGHTPNLEHKVGGGRLLADAHYEFDYDATAFRMSEDGVFGANEIKFLRLLFDKNSPVVLTKVQGESHLTQLVAPLVQTLQSMYLRT